MIGVLLTSALLLAVFVYLRQRTRKRRTELARPGATLQNAVVVTSFDEIDAFATFERCACGGLLRATGETSVVEGDRLLRKVHFECGRCERERVVHFDVTQAFH